MAHIELVYFAWVREAVGKDGERVVHPGPGTTVADLVSRLAERGGGYSAAFAEPGRLRAALDQEFVPLGTVIGDARELALFPPVTGG
ncbi:MAG TPA: MoaD/ThiS family protein [Sphingobium sp.]|nr:MoaD/ThiS family protein [Sphingobium sp.]